MSFPSSIVRRGSSGRYEEDHTRGAVPPSLGYSASEPRLVASEPAKRGGNYEIEENPEIQHSKEKLSALPAETPGEKEIKLDCTLGEGPISPGSADDMAVAIEEEEKDVPPGTKGWICLLGVSFGIELECTGGSE
jgi:hypothetical protein